MRRPISVDPDLRPQLLAKAYERFGLSDAGVTAEEFERNPAFHLRNMSRRLAGDKVFKLPTDDRGTGPDDQAED